MSSFVVRSFVNLLIVALKSRLLNDIKQSYAVRLENVETVHRQGTDRVTTRWERKSKEADRILLVTALFPIGLYGHVSNITSAC